MTDFQDHILALERLCTLSCRHRNVKAISLSADGLVAVEFFELPTPASPALPQREPAPSRAQSKRELIAAMRRAKAGVDDGATAEAVDEEDSD